MTPKLTPNQISELPQSQITDLVSDLAGKEPAITKNTAFNKNFGTKAGTVLEGSKDAEYAKLASANVFTDEQTIQKSGKSRLKIQETSGNTGSTAEIGFQTTGTAGSFAKGAIIYEDTGATFARGKLHLCTNDTALEGDATIADSRMTITSNGNVGIGTTSPGVKLESYASGTTSSAAAFRNDSSTIFFNGADIVSRNANNSAFTNMQLRTGAALNGINILTNGNVGIGTTSPGSKLSVVGLPTSATGLSSGDSYTQTAAQLGGIGTTKVLCIA